MSPTDDRAEYVLLREQTLLFNFLLFVDSRALSPKVDVKVTLVADMLIEPDYSTAIS